MKNGFRVCGLYPWNKTAIKLSKCLGRSRQKLFESHDTSDRNVFRKVCTILGEEKVKLFDQISEEQYSPERTEDFKALHKLYCFFKTNNFELKEKKTMDDTASQTDSPNLCNNISNIDIAGINDFVFLLEDENVEAIIPLELPALEIITKSENFSLPISVKQSLTSMNDILDWPETPIRKGTKVQKTKKSFVITNSIWIEEETKRKEERKKIEAAKEEKKLQD